jgi:DNA-directed RNA polymerase specialized sigma24 family protein
VMGTPLGTAKSRLHRALEPFAPHSRPSAASESSRGCGHDRS